jgi:hypothetical protein
MKKALEARDDPDKHNVVEFGGQLTLALDTAEGQVIPRCLALLRVMIDKATCLIVSFTLLLQVNEWIRIWDPGLAVPDPGSIA